MRRVFVCGPFSELQTRQASRMVRFLQEAARHGPLQAVVIARSAGEEVLLEERIYILQALRSVSSVDVGSDLTRIGDPPRADDLLAIHEHEDASHFVEQARRTGMELLPIAESELEGFPLSPHGLITPEPEKHVLVTGTFDWLHSGHVRFFEEVSRYGRLTVVVGHDDNIRLLKGEGHPLIPQDERVYMVQSIRYVHQALLATGHGWLDGEPEMERLKPDLFAVNEDGDRPEKRAYCEAHGIQYLVLRREPKQGLPRRSSTQLRGF